MSDNKIRYGLKNAHYSVIEEAGTAITYGLPLAIPGAVHLVLNPVGDKAEFYADDREYFGETANQGYDGDLEIALIPDHFRKNVLGDEEDVNGALIENAEAKPKKIALLYEFNGDIKQTRHVNYYCNVARPTIEGQTKEKGITPKTEVLKIASVPRPDGDVKARLLKGQTGYDSFFSKVYERNQAINTPETASVEFDKYSPADVTVKAVSTAATNAVYDVRLAGVSLPPVKLSIDGLEIVIDKSVFTQDTGVYPITVILDKGNVVDFSLTIKDTTP